MYKNGDLNFMYSVQRTPPFRQLYVYTISKKIRKQTNDERNETNEKKKRTRKIRPRLEATCTLLIFYGVFV